MNFTEFRFANTKRCRESFHPIDEWSMTDWACALGGEVGELQTLVFGMAIGESGTSTKLILEDVGREAADVVAYLDLLCVRLGIDLDSASGGFLNVGKFQRDQAERNVTTLKKGVTVLACGLGAAVGELLNLIKKIRRGTERGDKVFLPQVAQAAALALARVSLVCTCLGIDLEKAVILKFNEVSVRVGSSVKLR